MKLDLLPDVLVSSVFLAGFYTVLALAWVVLFRATGILNFATGQFVVLGGYLFLWLTETLSLPFVIGVLGAAAMAAAFGAFVHMTLLRRVAGRPIFTAIAVTLGLGIFMSSVMTMIWGPESRFLDPPFEPDIYTLPGDVRINGLQIATGVVSFLVFGAALAFFRFSRFGIRMRATAELPLLAAQRGVGTDVVHAASWGLSGVACTLVGISFALTNVLAPSGVQLGLRGLAPALVGGLNSVGGAIFGGFLVAVVENLAVLYLGADARDAAAFVVLLIFLAVRPFGLFGTQEVRRV